MWNTIFDRLNAMDHSLMLMLNYDGGIVQDKIWWAMSSKLMWILPVMLFLLYVYRKYNCRDAVAIIMCLALTVVLCDQISSSWIKPAVMRLRPSHDTAIQSALHYIGDYRGGLYGFVSSHAANAFGAVVFVSMIVRRKSITIILMLFAASVGYSRIYLGVHYPGDVVCGAILGMAIGKGMYVVCYLRNMIWQRSVFRIVLYRYAVSILCMIKTLLCIKP